MELKIRSICHKRLSIQSLSRKSNILMLGPDFDEVIYLLLTFFKAYSASLEPIGQVKSYILHKDQFFHLPLADTLEFIAASNEIFTGFRGRLVNESIFAYYKKKILSKRLSKKVENNLPAALKPNVLVIVLNGNRVIYDLADYKKLIAEFKGKGIYYPHAIVTRSESVVNQEITTEQVCFGLGISRSCVHFCEVYDEDRWQNSIETDLLTLQILTEILQ